MPVSLGNAALACGFLCSLAGMWSGVRGARRSSVSDIVRLKTLASLSLLAALGAVMLMQIALLTNDSSVAFVATHGSSRTPFPFNVATMWSALEGSILLWGTMVAALTVLVLRKFRSQMQDPLVAWAMVVMFAVSGFFFALMLTAAPVFRNSGKPLGFDGPGPNPLLQDHVLVAFHPPMLYLGYVGFTVPFAFAISALITGRVGEGWLAATRRWTLISWGFLSAGIVLGAWWAYEVSGWGGYWAWDPIENVSFLPWLTGTAFLHSVMVQERRGMLRVWNLSLVCATFSLTILGTFLARSGVVQSVHAFSNGSIGPVLLGAFAVITVGSVALIGWRGDLLRSPGAIDSSLSREGAFFANNLLFAAFAFIVLLGTVFPLIVESLNGSRVSVGGPFFDQMSAPIGIVLLFLMGVAPVLPWRAASTELLMTRLWWPAWTAVGGLGLAVLLGARGPMSLLGFLMAGFAAGSVFRQLTLATRRQGIRGLLGRANGGMVVHLGVIMIAVALVASQSYRRQGEFTLKEGESASVGGHRFTYEGSRIVDESNRREFRAMIRIDDGEVYEPSVNRYLATGKAVNRPSVQVGITRDLYLSITKEPSADDDSLRLLVVVEPLIVWLWIGGTIMCLGTLLALFPGKRRNPLDAVSAQIPGPATGPADGPEPGHGPGPTEQAEVQTTAGERA